MAEERKAGATIRLAGAGAPGGPGEAAQGYARVFERRGRILSRFSHDLRAPLNAVISFAQILSDGLSGELNAEQRQQVEIIEKSGRNLLHVIDNVIALSRVDAGRSQAVTTRVVLGQFLARLEADLRGAGQGEGAELRLRLEEGVPERAIFDERKVLLALNNMIRYALHASSDGRVEAVIGRAAGDSLPAFLGGAAPGMPRPEGFLKVSVRHQSSEFEKERIADLFRDLDEIDPAGSEQLRGVHLGLSLARRLLESLGGRVWVERPGRGEVVTVALLPLLREAEEEEAGPWPGQGGEVEPAAAAIEGKGTVLVVEDNPFNRNFIRVILGHMGFQVEEAENGEEGVRRAGELRPDLILMDMMMPVLDGFQATERLKGDPVTRDIPILAMTALSLEKDRRRARQAGCDDFLAMPSPREVVEEKISRWVAEGRARVERRGEGR